MVLPVVAVADSGNNTPRSAFATAPNTAWTAGGNLPTLSNGSGGSWSGIAYSPSLDRLVAIGEGSDNNNNDVATSDDHGVSWTGRAVPNQNTWTMNGICWSAALSLFVIVCSAGPTTTTRILTSPDGITWTARTIPDATKSLFSVAWSPELAIFCAVGNSNYIITSTDGITWTAQTGPATSKNWISICWAGDGAGGGMQLFVAVATGAGGSNDTMRSANGTAWTQQTLSGSAFSWQCIAYSPSQNRLAVVGGNTGVVVHSTNATSWTEIASGLGTTPFRGICWSESIGLWVGVCNGTNVLTSANGTSWTNNTGVAPATQGWRRVAAVTAAPAGPLLLVASLTDDGDVMTAAVFLQESLSAAMTDDGDVMDAHLFVPGPEVDYLSDSFTDDGDEMTALLTVALAPTVITVVVAM